MTVVQSQVGVFECGGGGQEPGEKLDLKEEDFTPSLTQKAGQEVQVAALDLWSCDVSDHYSLLSPLSLTKGLVMRVTGARRTGAHTRARTQTHARTHLFRFAGKRRRNFEIKAGFFFQEIRRDFVPGCSQNNI